MDVLYDSLGSKMTESGREFHAPQTITPEDLGDDLARLVWESFTDLVSEGEETSSLGSLALMDKDGNPDQHAVEEALIFLMWAHTRGAQQAFVGRAPGDLLKRTLDALHSAVFEDMVENGTPKSQLPFFEQRVSARYAEYHTASATSDTLLGEAVVQHMTGNTDPPKPLTRAVTVRAVEVTGPLRDYLEEVELVSS